jgi:hypothetical protein
MSFTESSMRSMREEAWRRENLVDQHTAAKMIGIDVRTLRRWHLQDIGPKRWPIRIHRRILYSRVEVEQFAATYNSNSLIDTHTSANGLLEADHDDEHLSANGHLEFDYSQSSANGHFVIK